MWFQYIFHVKLSCIYLLNNIIMYFYVKNNRSYIGWYIGYIGWESDFISVYRIGWKILYRTIPNKYLMNTSDGHESTSHESESNPNPLQHQQNQSESESTILETSKSKSGLNPAICKSGFESTTNPLLYNNIWCLSINNKAFLLIHVHIFKLTIM